MKYQNQILLCMLVLLAVGLAGCTRTVTKEVIVEVKVPVPSECLGPLPETVVPLRDILTLDEWNALTTDQRENLMAAQAIDRKTYGERMADAAVGCR